MSSVSSLTSLEDDPPVVTTRRKPVLTIDPTKAIISFHSERLTPRSTPRSTPRTSPRAKPSERRRSRSLSELRGTPPLSRRRSVNGDLYGDEAMDLDEFMKLQSRGVWDKTRSWDQLNYSDVLYQCERGLQQVKRMGSFTEKLAACTLKYAAEIAKVVSSERKIMLTLTSENRTDGLESSWQSYLGYIDEMGEMGIAHSMLGHQMQSQVVQPLYEFRKEKKAELQRLRMKESEFHISLPVLRSSVEKARSKALRALENVGLRIPTNKGMLDKFTNKRTITVKKQLKGLDIAHAQLKAYRKAIENANQFILVYKNRDRKSTLADLQNLEAMRATMIKSQIKEMTFNIDPLCEEYSRVSDALETLSSSIIIDDDMKDFVERYKDKAVNEDLEEFVYDLEVAPRDVVQIRWNFLAMTNNMEDLDSSKLFELSLVELMEFQKDTDPDLPVPVFLRNTLAAILEHGGANTVGIFRVSAESKKQYDTEIHLEKGKYKYPVANDPHVPANILKKWLYNLNEPLIPHGFYPYCVLHKDRESITESSIRGLLDRIPEINRFVLVEVVEMLSQIARNSEVTKMDFSNLAVVFTPCILDNPNISSLTSIEAMENAKTEKLFVEVLFNVLGRIKPE